MKARDEPTRLAAWINDRVSQMAREISQVAAEETTKLVEEVGHAVIDQAQAAAKGALALGSERVREYLRLRNRGD